MLHRYLEHFKMTAETLSLTRAARQLNISQPSLSRSIKILEDELQVSLFVRKSRGVELTDYGRALYRHSCFMEEEFDNARTEIESLRFGKLMSLRIGAGLLWLFNYLPSVLQTHSSFYPDIRYEVFTGYSENLYEAFLAGKYDIILCDLDSFRRVEGVVFEKLIDVNFTLFARDRHPIFTREPLSEDSLRDYEFAIFNHTEKEFDSPVQYIRRFYAIHERQIKLVTTSVVHLFESLTKSDSLASLPQQLASHAARYGLYEVSPVFRCSPFSSGAIYRAVSERKDVLQALTGILRGEVRIP